VSDATVLPTINESSGRRTRNTLVTVSLVVLAVGLLAFVRPPETAPGSPDAGPGAALIVRTETATGNAQGYLEAGEFQAAIDEINALPRDLLTADHYSIRGRAFYGLNDDETAIAELDRAIALAPQAAIYHSQRSQILLAEGDFQAAVEDLSQAIEKNSSEPRFHAQRAIARLQLKDYESAIVDYGNAIANASDQISNAEKAAWHNGRAAARVLLSSEPDSIRQALVDATAAVDAEPQESRHYRNRAQLYERLSDRSAQQKNLATAARLENGNT
jgi:tetratricopeptide (TPR) repeat protein